MKTCPACQTQYTDDTLQFCLQDGTPLMPARQADTPTAVFNASPSWQQSEMTHVAATQPKKAGSKMAIVVAATVLVMLVLFGAVGIGAWLYFRNPQTETANNISVKANIPIQLSNTNVRPSFTLQISPSGTPSPTRTANTSMPTNTVDEGQARSEVSQRLISWKSSAESLDLDGNMTHYAGIVDYYRKSGASAAFVRADKLRAFTRFDSINIKLTNISISVDQATQEATVTLDKEWDFEGRKSSSGKVKQLLKLSKISGQWLITAEKDMKVYFTR